MHRTAKLVHIELELITKQVLSISNTNIQSSSQTSQKILGGTLLESEELYLHNSSAAC